MLSSVTYQKIDDQGLHISVNGKEQILNVDTVVICVGQEPANGLYQELKAKGISVHVVGGAFEARELDAKVAIKQGSELAAIL